MTLLQSYIYFCQLIKFLSFFIVHEHFCYFDKKSAVTRRTISEQVLKEYALPVLENDVICERSSLGAHFVNMADIDGAKPPYMGGENH